jgi:hypothetical protein
VTKALPITIVAALAIGIVLIGGATVVAEIVPSSTTTPPVVPTAPTAPPSPLILGRGTPPASVASLPPVPSTFPLRSTPAPISTTTTTATPHTRQTAVAVRATMVALPTVTQRGLLSMPDSAWREGQNSDGLIVVCRFDATVVVLGQTITDVRRTRPGTVVQVNENIDRTLPVQYPMEVRVHRGSDGQLRIGGTDCRRLTNS